MTKTKRGGPRPGSGRPKKPKAEKKIKTCITLSPEHFRLTEGQRSELIAKALDFYFKVFKNEYQENNEPLVR